MSGPSNLKIQKTGAEEVGSAQVRRPLLILSVDKTKKGPLDCSLLMGHGSAHGHKTWWY